MRADDLGIDIKTGYHQKNPLTHVENAFLGVLWVDHVGADNKVAANRLTFLFARKLGAMCRLSEMKREIRYLQNHMLFDHNIPVLSKAGPDGGYWIAETKAEAEEFYGTFRKRGLTGVVKASRGKQSAMVDMVTQLSFEFDEMLDLASGRPASPAASPGQVAAPIEVVDAFLKKMLKDPERFSEGLKMLGEKYGSVLMPRKRFDAMVAELNKKAQEIAGIAASLGQ